MSGADEGAEHGFELGLGLGPFGVGVGAGDDARAGAQHRGASVDLAAAQGDRPLAVAAASTQPTGPA